MSKRLEVFIGLICVGIIVAALIPAVSTHPPPSPKNMSRSACRAIEAALLQFYTEYSQFPNFGNESNVLDAEMIGVLVGVTSKQNPRQRKFLSIDVKNEVLVDGWGNPYFALVDSDYDNKVKVGSQLIDAQVVVWSAGKNGINEFGLGDDVSTHNFESE